MLVFDHLLVTALAAIPCDRGEDLPHCNASVERGADEGTAYFFLGNNEVGSDTIFNPITVLINNGLDILRQPTYSRSPAAIDWGTGFRNVWANLSDPGHAIERVGGWDEFIAHEVFPYRGFGGGRVQWIPNFTLHLLGEGMLYRKLWEWYDANGFPAPALWGLATSMTAALLNEAGENGAYRGANWDPIADIYIFNVLGYVLFSVDAVADFFRGPVEISYWPGQAVLAANDGRLFNHGENYAVKISVGDWTDLRIFVQFGHHALFGLTIPGAEGHEISVGAGVGLVGLQAFEEGAGGRLLTHDERKNFEVGLFWDQQGSLLGSLMLGGVEDPFVRLNLFPGYIRWNDLLIGLYVVAGRFEGIAAGLTVAPFPLVPGVGVAGDQSSQVF